MVFQVKKQIDQTQVMKILLTQFNIGTRFEQYDDIFLSPNIELSFDDMTVDGTASERLKKTSWFIY